MVLTSACRRRCIAFLSRLFIGRVFSPRLLSKGPHILRCRRWSRSDGVFTTNIDGNLLLRNSLLPSNLTRFPRPAPWWQIAEVILLLRSVFPGRFSTSSFSSALLLLLPNRSYLDYSFSCLQYCILIVFLLLPRQLLFLPFLLYFSFIAITA